MPTGIKNALAVFQRFVKKIVDDLIRDNNAIVYMEDIMVVSMNVEEHLTAFGQMRIYAIKHKIPRILYN